MSAQNDSQYDPETANAIADFRDFLDDEKPPLFITASLTRVLGTEGPVTFGADRAAEVVADWAEERAGRTGESVSDLMLGAMRHIVDAYGMNAITDFKPKAFYRPFAAGILARCPEAERDGLQAALQDMQGTDPQRRAIRSTADYKVADVNAGGQRLNRESAIFTYLPRLENVRMSDEEFETAIDVLRRAIVDHPTLPAPSALRRLIELSVITFNAGAVGRSGRMFQLVADGIARLEADGGRNRELRNHVKSTQLENTILVAAVNDPARHADVAPVIRYFADLAPSTSLAQLATERNAAKARFLTNVLEVFGSGAYPAVLAQFASPDLPARGPEFAGHLLQFLARAPPPSEVDRKRAVEAAGRYVGCDKAALRTAALAALLHAGGKDMVPHLARAFDAPSYGRIDGPAETEEARSHLADSIRALLETGQETGAVVLAEVATGLRGAEFKFGRAVREMAVEALAAWPGTLPRRAVLVLVAGLKTLAGGRFKIFTGSLALGVDSDACLALMRLIEGSSEPEAREVLELPVLRKIAAKAGAR